MSQISEPVRIELDVALTRLTRTHAAVDAEGVQVYHARRISEVLRFLADHDIRKAVFVDDIEAFSVVFHPTTPPEPQAKEPDHE